MKRILSLLFMGLFLLALASCGSAKAGCDAYGDLQNQMEQNDLANK